MAESGEEVGELRCIYGETVPNPFARPAYMPPNHIITTGQAPQMVYHHLVLLIVPL